MSRQAEAERERRAQVIAADGEYQASTRLAEAATVMAADPAALQLRLLQTVVEVAAEKNSTLVMPFPSNCCASSTTPPRRKATSRRQPPISGRQTARLRQPTCRPSLVPTR